MPEAPTRVRGKPHRRPGPGNETLLVRAVIKLLHRLGCPAWRCGVGSKEWIESDGTRRFAMFGMKGLPDVLGIVPPIGRLIAIEVKVNDNPLSHDQQRVLDDFKSAGALAAVVRDSTDGLAELVRDAIDAARRQRREKAS